MSVKGLFSSIIIHNAVIFICKSEHTAQKITTSATATANYNLTVFFFGAVFFLGAVFLGAAFFLGAFLGFPADLAFSLKAALNLYEALTFTKSPASTPSLRALRKAAFIHFLSAARLACMCFLMAMEEEPVRSLSSVMALTIPAL